MKRYDALGNSFGEHKIKYTLQCGTCRGSFTTQVLGNCKGAEAMSTDIFEILEESNLTSMEFDHLRLRFNDDGLIIAFLNNDGEEVMAIDPYWYDIDRERLIVGIEIVDFEEDSKEKKGQRCSNTLRLNISPFPPEKQELTDMVVGQTRADISKTEITEDMVNHPSHYKLANGMETKEILKQLLTPEEYRGWCKGNALKYQFRAGKKNPTKLVQDYEKTQWFLRELVEVLADEKQD